MCTCVGRIPFYPLIILAPPPPSSLLNPSLTSLSLATVITSCFFSGRPLSPPVGSCRSDSHQPSTEAVRAGDECGTEGEDEEEENIRRQGKFRLDKIGRNRQTKRIVTYKVMRRGNTRFMQIFRRSGRQKRRVGSRMVMLIGGDHAELAELGVCKCREGKAAPVTSGHVKVCRDWRTTHHRLSPWPHRSQGLLHNRKSARHAIQRQGRHQSHLETCTGIRKGAVGGRMGGVGETNRQAQIRWGVCHVPSKFLQRAIKSVAFFTSI